MFSLISTKEFCRRIIEIRQLNKKVILETEIYGTDNQNDFVNDSKIEVYPESTRSEADIHDCTSIKWELIAPHLHKLPSNQLSALFSLFGAWIPTYNIRSILVNMGWRVP